MIFGNRSVDDARYARRKHSAIRHGPDQTPFRRFPGGGTMILRISEKLRESPRVAHWGQGLANTRLPRKGVI